MLFSVIIPVYNRPEEVKDLLESISSCVFRDFEIIIVEDGSKFPCLEVVRSFTSTLSIKYLTKSNGGPACARNFGAKSSVGEYLLFLDSDTTITSNYFNVLADFVKSSSPGLFGGPDMSSDDFTPLQKAISYSMTSFFTTGGIRGGKKKITKFIPRSFNMGVLRSAFESVDGFAPMRFGEDLDLSMRLIESGYSSFFVPEATVYHKRRTSLKGFYRQVCNSGRARVDLTLRHKGSLKFVHLLPLAFFLGSIALLFASCISGTAFYLLPLLIYAFVVFIDSSFKEKSPIVGLLSVLSAFIQLYGYAIGFIDNFFKRVVFKKSLKANIDNDRFYS